MEKVRSYISNHHRDAEPFYIKALEIAEQSVEDVWKVFRDEILC